MKSRRYVAVVAAAGLLIVSCGSDSMEHVWKTGDPAKDPVQFQDATPIGTGPFEVNPCNPNLITYTAR